MTDPRVDEALQLALSIGTLMEGKDQAVRGAALAQVLACWLVSHPHPARETLLIDHAMSARRMMLMIDEEKKSDA